MDGRWTRGTRLAKGVPPVQRQAQPRTVPFLPFSSGEVGEDGGVVGGGEVVLFLAVFAVGFDVADAG